MKIVFCVVVLIGISLRASAQIETGTGTLVILDATQDEIVVAADSRMHYEGKDLDDRCKISALGNELIFAASGTTYFFSPDGKIVWDAHTIARNVFDRLSRERAKDPIPLRVANAWGNEIKKKLEADAIKNPQETVQYAYGNVLGYALFAGFYGHPPFITSPFIVEDTITYTTAHSGQININFSADIVDTVKEPVQMIGHTDIAYELNQGETDRARKWSQDMKARMPKGADPFAFRIIESIRYSIHNYRRVKVGDQMVRPIGGPIDAVRLKRTGGIDWIQRKPNCPSK